MIPKWNDLSYNDQDAIALRLTDHNKEIGMELRRWWAQKDYTAIREIQLNYVLLEVKLK